MKAYIAAPLFTNEEKDTIRILSNCLNHAGIETYLPMEHGVQNAWSYSNIVWGKMIADLDVKAIDDCDILVCIYNGMNSDSGTSWEIGYAYGRGKPIYVFHNYDTNIPENQSSVMVYNSAVANVDNLVDLCSSVVGAKNFCHAHPYQS